MKLRIGPIPEDPGFDPKVEGWSRLREPGLRVLVVLAVVVGLVIVGVLLLLILAVAPGLLRRLSWPHVIVFVIVVAPVHELIHVILQPHFGLSDKTTVGLWVAKVALYTHYEGTMSRGRYIVISMAPFVLLSLLPIGVASLGRIDLPHLINVAISNGLASSADVIGAILVGFQVPRGASVRNKGLGTYWRIPSQARP